MKTRVILAALTAIAVLGAMFWAYGAQWFNPRPTQLSLDISDHQAVPVVKYVQLNEAIYHRVRATNIRESGGIPYLSAWNNDLRFTLMWVEMFNDQAWHAEFTVPVERLSTFPDLRRLAVIDISIGPGGDLLVTTDQEERLRLIGEQRSLEITDALREPDVIFELCAERLANDDPRRLDLIAGFEAWSVEGAISTHLRWMQSNPLPTSRCSPNWSLEDE